MNKLILKVVLILFIAGVPIMLLVSKYNIPNEPVTEFTNYNPVPEVSQERLDDWRNLAWKNGKLAQERGEKIETLERQIAETKANNARFHTNSHVQTARAKTKQIKTNKPGVEQWRPLVKKYFLAQHVDDALIVMSGESGGDPNAKNPNSSASGLFQHLARYWPNRSASAGWAGASIFDPEANIAVAAWLSKGGANWNHWQIKPR
ncbi:transglycosylase SLT domain-containing protein [Candidatus Oleimmundimicrobium sp.]|uniref:transglycosylase SLT domain-containing protein n=1 Tax=Candidatus Oleimmundimicrobium sp. TaxID=3060597 RepID=UPI002724B82C|nr:transglycosylase SLT domain-containing protein [Candidatus Oleimmundimicrobium sp.]MDO8885754.1 transglycosylase SLT domain-containing protein [Candidatus Oleimmundimicrobium sp.]